ncbi:MAG: iron ABC transporter permease [Anaeromicrobium sp.]|uniref:ABC transporter permease n=1 Tax=Anaeromicrobium sp. TaxID=1929132 RepID=UPI0025F8F5C4|nr:iron ABC transporter permease [Anaeromicrobium sp.]MCT4595329.1 iron ABC transporter permease [Anaeromicrobium sp.]
MYNILTREKFNMMKIIVFFMVVWVLGGYILYPTVKTICVSFTGKEGLTLSFYKEFFLTKENVEALVNTLILGFSTVIVCGIIGTTLAFYVTYFNFPLKNFTYKLLLTPLMLPGIIIVIAFIQLYGESGMITKTVEILFKMNKGTYFFSGFLGILFVHAYTQYVYFFMNVSVAIKHIDYSVIEAAKNLGASKFKIFTTIILPFIRPALIASSIITFMTGIGSFTAPSLIGDHYKVLTTQILFTKANNYMELAAVQVIMLTIISIVFLLLFRHYEKRVHFISSVNGKGFVPINIENKFIKTIFMVISITFIFFIILPLLTIVFLSFVKPGTWMVEIYPREFSLDNYMKIFTKSRTMAPFMNSISMSIIASLFGAFVAIPCAYIIVKTEYKFKFIVEVLAMLPWAMPASAIAINMINAFNKPSIFSFKGILVGTYILLPLAYFVKILPLVLRTTSISLQNLSDTYEEASKSLGGSFLYTFRRITLPIIMPGIMAGILLGFIRCVGEYTTSVYLYTVWNKPISMAMVNALFEYEIGLAMAYGVLIIILTALVSGIITKLGNMGRIKI